MKKFVLLTTLLSTFATQAQDSITADQNLQIGLNTVLANVERITEELATAEPAGPGQSMTIFSEFINGKEVRAANTFVTQVRTQAKPLNSFFNFTVSHQQANGKEILYQPGQSAKAEQAGYSYIDARSMRNPS